MLTFIIGPNNSGKSSCAESIISKLDNNNRYYIATMIPYGEEGRKRVKKHIKMRENLNMETLEDPYLGRLNEIMTDSDVLLEDLSNLVANRMFEMGPESCDSILTEILDLNSKVRNLVVVSIGGIVADGYDEETVLYINRLNEINNELSKVADAVINMENF